MLLIQLVTMINYSENHENVILGEYYEIKLGMQLSSEEDPCDSKK